MLPGIHFGKTVLLLKDLELPFTHYNIAEQKQFYNRQNPKKMHIKPRCRQYPTSGFHATLNVMALNKSEQRRLILFGLPLNSPSAYQTTIQPLLIHKPSAVWGQCMVICACPILSQHTSPSMCSETKRTLLLCFAASGSASVKENGSLPTSSKRTMLCTEPSFTRLRIIHMIYSRTIWQSFHRQE